MLGVLSIFFLMGCQNDKVATVESSKSVKELKQLTVWEELPSLPNELGVAGPFSGVHNDVLIVAGGANFKKPFFDVETVKSYYTDIYLLKKVQSDEESGSSFQWIDSNLSLEKPAAYGASIATNKGLICIGGHNADGVEDENGEIINGLSDVFLLSWDLDKEKLVRTELPSLPAPCTQMSASASDYDYSKAIIYLAAGSVSSDIKTATDQFIKLDLSSDDPKWESVNSVVELEQDGETLLFSRNGTIPGGARIVAPSAMQFDGRENCFYLFGGRRSLSDKKAATLSVDKQAFGLEFINDSWKYSPLKNQWTELENLPESMMACSAWNWGLNHLFVLNGASGANLVDRLEKGYDESEQPLFENRIWAYHTVTDSWIKASVLGEDGTAVGSPANQVTTPAVRWGSDRNAPMMVVSGEIKPRIRSAKIWSVTLADAESSFGWVNYLIIIVYLIGIVGVGIFFYFRNKSVDDFFKGGGRIPFWVAAFSLFATMLSSITFIAVPGKVFATDWRNYMLYASLLVVTPFVISFLLPFFRQIKSASAYEYLENRFNLLTRLVAGVVFMFYHILRMGIVMYLPALALSSIIKMSSDPQLNMIYAILIMGLLSLVYCSMGGLEAVVWTDTIQSFVLLGGAFVAVLIIIVKTGGPADFFETAMAGEKFKMAVWDFSLGSYKNPVLWVLLLGGLGQNLIPYASDQAIIQRYMSVKDMKSAKKSIWTNTWISLGAGTLFFFVGTALFVFYKKYAGSLSPSLTKVDEVFPQFIVNELPIGIAGIVVAAILAAAQSTVSTSINSATAVLISDFVIRFSKEEHPKRDLLVSRLGTIVFGLLGTGFAVILVKMSDSSLWDSFLTMLGLVLGALCGLFILGVFFKKANGPGVLLGAAGGVALTLFSKYLGFHPYLFGIINVVATTFCGIIISLIFRALKITGESDDSKRSFLARLLLAPTGNAERYSLKGMKNQK